MEVRKSTFALYTILIIGAVTNILPAQHRSGTMETDSVRYYITLMQTSYDTVENYTCLFHKQERIDGEWRPQELMRMKYRKPQQIYLKWIQDPYKGREVLYRQGWNENKLRVNQETFRYLTLNLDPTGTLAMKGNRHPVTTAGLGFIIQTLKTDFQESLLHTEDSVRYYNNGHHIIYNRSCVRLNVEAPVDVSSRYYAHLAIIDIDTQNHLPIHLIIKDNANQLIEEYGFENLRLNPGLTLLDFNPDNSVYGF